MLTPQEIKSALEKDCNSEYKRSARKGQRYYDGLHDILDYRIFYYDANGRLQEDRSRSNIKIPHQFFTELVDQEVQYVLSGKEGFVYSELPKLQEELNARFNDNDDFRSELHDAVSGAVICGCSYLYAYKNTEDKLAFQCADCLYVAEVQAKYASDHHDYCIYKSFAYVDMQGKRIYRIEVFGDNNVTIFRQEDDGLPTLDKTIKPNPRPHVLYRKHNEDTTYYEGLGFIPFFRLDHNRKRMSGLAPIKALIDDYDLMACGLSNNLQDLTEGIYVVKGYQGDDLDQLQQNLKTKKMVGVDAEGDVDIRTIQIPTEARKTKLELDEKNIYRFGMGFNSTEVGDGNITNIVIKSRYALLDLKCNKLEARLKQFLRKIVNVVLEEINRTNGTAYQSSDVYFRFDREVMTNASDNAQIALTEAQTRQTEINTLLNLLSNVPEEPVRRAICEQMEWDYEELKNLFPEHPEEDTESALQLLNGASDE